MDAGRKQLEPLRDLSPELAEIDGRLADAFLAERLLLPSGVVRAAMLSLPHPASAFARATRWGAAVVLAGAMVGVWLLYQVIYGTAHFGEWTDVEWWGYAAGAGAILLAMALNLAAPRLALWIRSGLRRWVNTPTAPLTAEVLAWRVGAFVLLMGVWLALR